MQNHIKLDNGFWLSTEQLEREVLSGTRPSHRVDVDWYMSDGPGRYFDPAKLQTAIGLYSFRDKRAGSPDGTDLASVEIFRFGDGDLSVSTLNAIVAADEDISWDVNNGDGTRSTMGWKPSATTPGQFDATVTHYTVANRKYSETVFYHNGSRKASAWDVNGTEEWASYVQTYDTEARLTKQVYQNDDGTYRIVEWDVNGLHPWWEMDTLYNAQDLSLYRIEYDDLRQKAAERWWDRADAYDWAEYTREYDYSGRPLCQEWLNDDGTRRILETDFDGIQDWITFDQRYDASGNRTLAQYYFYADHIDDHEGYIVTYGWDFAGEDWTSYVTRHDALERETYQYTVHDNGLKYRQEWDASNVDTWATIQWRYDDNDNLYYQLTIYDDDSDHRMYRHYDHSGEDWDYKIVFYDAENRRYAQTIDLTTAHASPGIGISQTRIGARSSRISMISAAGGSGLIRRLSMTMAIVSISGGILPIKRFGSVTTGNGHRMER
jgi:hypothetical protein